MKATKDEVYKQIVRYLKIEGHPMGSNADFNEASVNDLVLLIISPNIEAFIDTTGRCKVRLLGEKQIVSEDGQTGGYEEFVVVSDLSHRRKVCLHYRSKKSITWCSNEAVSIVDEGYGG